MTDLGISEYHARVRQEKRRAALDAARREFGAHGYEGASMQQISARAQLSSATLFKHFPTKAELFEEVVVDVWRPVSLNTPKLESLDMTGALTAIGKSFVSMTEERDMVSFYRLLASALYKFPELGRVVLDRGRLPFIREIGAFLHRRLGSSGWPADELDVIAAQFLTMIADQTFWPRIFVPDLVVSEAEVDRAVEAATRTIAARLSGGPS